MVYYLEMKKRGEWLKARREELKQQNKTKFSIRALAGRVGVSYAGLSHLENNDAMPALDLGLKLAHELDRSPEWVLTGVYNDARTGIPVIGSISTGPDTEWLANGMVDNTFPSYVDISVPERNLYGLTVDSGDVIGYRVGEVLIADPKMEPVTGEDVIIITKDGVDSGVKVLASQRDGKVYLDTPGGASQRVIRDLDDIVLMHPIILVAKSIAVKGI